METPKQESKKKRSREIWEEWEEKLEKLITRKNELQDDIIYWRKTIDTTQYEAQYHEEIDLMDLGGGPDYSIVSLQGMEDYSRRSLAYIQSDIKDIQQTIAHLLRRNA